MGDFMSLRTVVSAFLLIVLLSGCNSLRHAQESKHVSLGDMLAALDDAGIYYEIRTESRSVYDMEREVADRHLYQLETGNLTIYSFTTVDQRKEVQRDPFPTANAVSLNGSYGIDTILVFYYDGDTTMAKKLLKAFNVLGVVEDRNQL